MTHWQTVSSNMDKENSMMHTPAHKYFTPHPESPVTKGPFIPSVSATLQTRANSHGDFIANGITMQALKGYVRSVDGYCNLTMPQREALDMILHKIGRILNGNPNFADHWHDIAGYATLIENIITTGKAISPTSK